ncbi:hypothetical protein HPB52_025245 [Rhipicephalus sanguineus]|uniref:Uncharacterized protein n=1 Tax=Rhipicephalus sanguineus TaxID=34632 RepID=A0A9D4TDD1_RHISA|nr:hypothetical protein HPB52_025245 [Rhipicephalus sanguineus]
MSGRPFRGGRRGGGFFPEPRTAVVAGVLGETPQTQRESRARKIPTKKELQEIAAAVTKSIVQDKEQRIRSKTPVRTRSALWIRHQRGQYSRSLSPVRGDGGGSPYSSSRDYPVTRPKTPSLKQKDSSGMEASEGHPVRGLIRDITRRRAKANGSRPHHPGLGIDENIDDEDAFLYGDEGLTSGRPPSGPERRSSQEKQPFVEERKKHAPQDSWMPAPQRFGGGPPSPEESDLTIDLKLPFDHRKTAEPPRPGKGFPDSRAQHLEQPAPQRGGRRGPDRVADEPPPSTHGSQLTTLIIEATKQSKQSMLGYSSIESMKQELRELKMMLSRGRKPRRKATSGKGQGRRPTRALTVGGRSPSPLKRRRESYSPIHRRRGRSPVDSYRRPSPPSAPTIEVLRRLLPADTLHRRPAVSRRLRTGPWGSAGHRAHRPERHGTEDQRDGLRVVGEPRKPAAPATTEQPGANAQASVVADALLPGLFAACPAALILRQRQPSGPPLVPPPNLSVPPPNYPMNAPPPQTPYFAGYPPPAQAPPDFSYPPPSAQQQQPAVRSNLRVVPLQSGAVDNAVKDERAFSPINVKQEDKVVPKKLSPVTQEEIDNYLSLVELKDSHREKLNLLKQELVRISKIQNEMMRRRQHKR